jgi:hypothetical protein
VNALPGDQISAPAAASETFAGATFRCSPLENVQTGRKELGKWTAVVEHVENVENLNPTKTGKDPKDVSLLF